MARSGVPCSPPKRRMVSILYCIVVVEQGLTSHRTHYSLIHVGHIRDGFYGSKDPTNSVKALKEERS